VRNTGTEHRGVEVVQLYISFPAAADEPDLVLRGFEKTRLLAPGKVPVRRRQSVVGGKSCSQAEYVNE
jgi:hypothetical protein